MTLKEYFMIRKYLMFHYIRKDKIYKETIEEIINNTNIEMNELDDLIPIENDNTHLEEMNELEFEKCYNTTTFDDIDLTKQFEDESNIVINYMNYFINRIEMKMLKQTKENINLMKEIELFKELKQEIEKIMKCFKKLIEKNKIFNNKYNVNKRITQKLNRIKSEINNKQMKDIINKLKFLVDDYIPNVFKNVKKAVINEYNYVKKYNENKKMLFEEIRKEDFNFDLYGEDDKDGNYLIRDVINEFNNCLKETKVISYGESFSIDETLSYCSCRTKFIQKIPRKPAGKGMLSFCLCKPNVPYLCNIMFYRGKSIEGKKTLDQKLLLKSLMKMKIF